jgi:hypothetical protein
MLFTITSTNEFYSYLRIATLQLKVGFALFTLSLCLPLKVALFFILLHFTYL